MRAFIYKIKMLVRQLTNAYDYFLPSIVRLTTLTILLHTILRQVEHVIVSIERLRGIENFVHQLAEFRRDALDVALLGHVFTNQLHNGARM